MIDNAAQLNMVTNPNNDREQLDVEVKKRTEEVAGKIEEAIGDNFEDNEISNLMFENIKWYKEKEALEFLKGLEVLLESDGKSNLKLFFLNHKSSTSLAISSTDGVLKNWRYFKNVFFKNINPVSTGKWIEKIFQSKKIFELIEVPESGFSAWKGIDLSQILIKNIKIGDEVISLWDNYITVDTELFRGGGRNPVDESANYLDFGTCPALEEKFREVLGCVGSEKLNTPWLYEIISIGGQPIGIMKFHGEETMIASKTVVSQNGEILFYKGMAYALATHNQFFTANLGKKYLVNKLNTTQWTLANTLNTWNINLDDLAAVLKKAQPGNKIIKNNLRWVRSVEIIRALEELTKNIENGEIDLENINIERMFD